jgi:hypothetical protein
LLALPWRGQRCTLLVDRLAGGQSNPTYRLTSGNQRYVLRPAQFLNSAHAIDREFPVTNAPRDTEVPGLVFTLAADPTRAHGAIRRKLRQSFETGPSDQPGAERESIIAAGRSGNPQVEIAAFVAKRPPQFLGTADSISISTAGIHFEQLGMPLHLEFYSGFHSYPNAAWIDPEP